MRLVVLIASSGTNQFRRSKTCNLGVPLQSSVQSSAEERIFGTVSSARSGGGTGCSPSRSTSRFEGKIHIASVAATVSSGSKKTKAARKHRGNQNLAQKKQVKMTTAVMEALEDDENTKVFGRVIKILGGIYLQVFLTDGTQYNAVMRGLLRKRGHTPIEAGSVVMLERPDPTIKSEQVLEVQAVIDYKAASLLVKMKTIPQWFMTLGVGEVPPKGGKDEYDYDYLETQFETDEEGNIVVPDSGLAQSIAQRFCYNLKSTDGGEAEPEANDEIKLTEEEIDNI